jgi:hypothetical protein
MFAVSANAACAAPAATASAARPCTGHATPARFHQKAAFVGAQVRMGRAAQSRRTAVQCRAAVGKDAAEVGARGCTHASLSPYILSRKWHT